MELINSIKPDKDIAWKACIKCGSENLFYKKWALEQGFKMAECCSCGFNFITPRPSLEELTEYYNSITTEYFYKHSDKKAKKVSKKFYNLIRAYGKDPKTILEIGCSSGYHLQGLKLRGFEVTGTELSARAVQVAYEWYGINIFNSEFPPINLTDYFDVVIVHHVIEHVLNPVNFIYDCSKFLKKDGILIVETPNIKSIGNRIFKKHYPVICPPGHLNFFNISTLKQILPSCIRVLKVKTTSNELLAFYNSVVALMSILSVKKKLYRVINQQRRKRDVENHIRIDGYKSNKEVIMSMTKYIQFIFSPVYLILDKSHMGENVLLIGVKK